MGRTGVLGRGEVDEGDDAHSIAIECIRRVGGFAKGQEYTQVGCLCLCPCL